MMGAYAPDGYQGDWGFIQQGASAAMPCPTPPAGAKGSCHAFTYNFGADAGVLNWAGVSWHYPQMNWGALPGYGIPAGATKVMFNARGAMGGEVVTFSAGGSGVPTLADPCQDTVTGSTIPTTLTTSWTPVTIPLTGTYAGGVINGFTWSASNMGQGDGGATSITFFIDDIEWSM
jgi:hypothetical protein